MSAVGQRNLGAAQIITTMRQCLFWVESGHYDSVVNSTAMYPVSSANPAIASIRCMRAYLDAIAALAMPMNTIWAPRLRGSGRLPVKIKFLASEAERASKSAEKNQRDSRK